MAYQLRGKPAIFVFGSNLSGVHGAGAAKYAMKKRGAVMGVGSGPTGDSYALPTKGLYPQLPTLLLTSVSARAQDFMRHAEQNPQTIFQLTAVGCGLAGFTNEQIAPLFADAPDNVLLPPEWEDCMGVQAPQRFWQYDEIPD